MYTVFLQIKMASDHLILNLKCLEHVYFEFVREFEMEHLHVALSNSFQ